MNSKPKDGLIRLIETISDSSQGGIFYIYGDNWTEQQAILKRVEEIAVAPEVREFDIAQADVRHIDDGSFREIFNWPPNGVRQLIIFHCADKMTADQRAHLAACSPFFLQDSLIILVNTPHTKKDESLSGLQDMVEIEVS